MSTVQTTLSETDIKELLKQAVAEVLQEMRFSWRLWKILL